jgi:hypothetical protein
MEGFQKAETLFDAQRATSPKLQSKATSFVTHCFRYIRCTLVGDAIITSAQRMLHGSI